MSMADCRRLACAAAVLAGALASQPAPPSLEPLYREALAEREKALGPQHVKVAASLVDLALFLERNGQPAAAEPLLLRARAIYKDKDAVALAAVLAKLGELAGQSERAQDLLRESLEAHATLRAASALADLRERAGRLDEAEKLRRKALELAATSEETAAAANNLALVIEAQGRTSEAEPLFARAAALYEKSLGRNHPEFATVLLNLAGTVRARVDIHTAAGMARNAWAVLEATLGSAHPHTRAACNSVREMLAQAGNEAEAASVQRHCR
jgi:tetratricopeptide (TPR) repeat protein